MKYKHPEINVLAELPALLRFLPSTLHYMSITQKLQEKFSEKHRQERSDKTTKPDALKKHHLPGRQLHSKVKSLV